MTTLQAVGAVLGLRQGFRVLHLELSWAMLAIMPT
jgi:hypothetical protein